MSANPDPNPAVLPSGFHRSNTGAELGRRLREHDLTAAAAAVNLLENSNPALHREIDDLSRAVSPAVLGHELPGKILGLTGPPGVGKSTLLSQLVAWWRERDIAVAVLAIDPTSRRSGGSLLGDRARIERESTDERTFIRSMAASTRLGGLAPATYAAATVLAAAFDIVIVETVGVGQSETDIAELADLVAVVVQPGSGDVLQFLKAGIMEVPDLLIVTKADSGRPARRAVSDLRSALHALAVSQIPVLPVCSVPPVTGIDELAQAFDARHAEIDLPARRLHARRAHALDEFILEHGERGVRLLGGRRAAARWLTTQDPALDATALLAGLERQAERT